VTTITAIASSATFAAALLAALAFAALWSLLEPLLAWGVIR
jgi:hypothetical protein